ncbi:MAG: alpha/beta fold hydrolase [Halioglobus sp.]|nr:alpha/beta fold hydrolase [Halioglobus sp.]
MTAQPHIPADDHVVTLNPIVGMSLEDLGRAGIDVLQAGVSHPMMAAEHLLRFNRELVKVMLGRAVQEPASGDRRFQDEGYRSSRLHSRLMQGWLALNATVNEWVESMGFEGNELERARFVAALVTDAVAPSNFLLGNPAALRKARESRGASLVAGLGNLVNDLRHNNGMPSQVDKSAFTVGTNLAATPGAVIHRSEILELIQYQPRTAKQQSRPVLIVPPQINKYYVYDLSPDKSMVGYLLEQGFQVYMVPWRNPGREHRSWGLDDYVLALDEAIDVCRDVSKAPAVNVVGACAGGITLATAVAWLAGRDELNKIASLSLMVNVLQPAVEDSVIGLFASDKSIEAARKKSARAGVLDGSDTARVFNWMRANDLIWNYVSSNYLLGETPPAFDILYWNNDTTRLPARLHSDFLDIFKDNLLTKRGELEIKGVPIDLKNVTVPAYVTGGTTDHITPWQACYRTTQLLGGPVNFVLSTAGHIQSFISPPTSSKRKFFTNPKKPRSAEIWAKHAQEHKGSWWPHWTQWLRSIDEGEVKAATTLGNASHPPLVPAPGTYVHE